MFVGQVVVQVPPHVDTLTENENVILLMLSHSHIIKYIIDLQWFCPHWCVRHLASRRDTKQTLPAGGGMIDQDIKIAAFPQCMDVILSLFPAIFCVFLCNEGEQVICDRYILHYTVWGRVSMSLLFFHLMYRQGLGLYLLGRLSP